MSDIQKRLAKFTASRAKDRKFIESRKNFVPRTPVQAPADFSKWIEGRNRTYHKAFLYEQPYRPPRHLLIDPVDPDHKELPPLGPTVVYSKARPLKVIGNRSHLGPNFYPPKTWKARNPERINTTPESSGVPSLKPKKSIEKRPPPKGKKLKTGIHCSLCPKRHLSSIAQLEEHEGSATCRKKAQTGFNNLRCPKCRKRFDNLGNYHRHRDSKCYKN